MHRLFDLHFDSSIAWADQITELGWGDRMIANRRQFIRGAGMLSVAAGLTGGGSLRGMNADTSHQPKRIDRVELDLDHIRKWDDSNGDTWDPFWADDGRLYSFNCDGRGFGKRAKNLALNLLSGDSIETLSGSQVNSMDEYGDADQRGPDHATWKVCGQECIDGIFYAFVARNVYGHESHDPLTRQTSMNASLIRSDDRGSTWRRTAAENYTHPMWPGGAFGAPFFVHYGRDGGQAERDRSSEYVYAVSTNGFWNDGDYLVLGRVPRKRIGMMNTADWQYYRGGEGHKDEAWGENVFESAPLLARPARCGQTPITFVPPLDKYLLISWYNPDPLPSWFKPKEMRYDLMEADHPWGAWSQIASFSDRFLAPGKNMYGPSICARFQRQFADHVEAIMFTSGCQFEDVPTGIYKGWSIPLLLWTVGRQPKEALKCDSGRFEKHGAWALKTADPGYENGALFSSTATDYLLFNFVGTSFDICARKSHDYGAMQVVVDEMPTGIVNLATVNLPEIFGAVVFRSSALPPGRHSVRIENAVNKPANLQSVVLY
jgi:hypothetical protein